MQKNHLRRSLVLVVAAQIASPVFAQQTAAAPVGAPQAQPVAYQQGVVYPGQPIAPTSPQPVAGVAVPQGAGAPKLPALPGAAAQISPAQQAVDDVMPRDAPRAVRELKVRVDRFEKEGARKVRADPVPKSRSIDLTQAPGETPPIIRIATGIPTTVAFIDSSGAPWPIAYLTPGAPGEFDALVPQVGDSSMYLLPKSDYAYGAVTVKLVDNPVPITFMVTAAQREVDTRVDAHIVTRRGPNAKPAMNGFANAGTAPDPILSGVLDGVPPTGAKVRKTSAPGISAWSFGGRLYVRTEAQLTSPNWYASKFSGNTRAYALPDVSAITVSVDGEMSVVTFDD
jgi:intracellular multiplication protein IcmK